MGPEQLPDNKGGRPPPERIWLIREGEMSPQETRALGHLLYAGMFVAGPSQSVEGALYEEASASISPPAAPDDFDVKALPARLYIDKFAQIYGLNASVLTRFAHAASMEFAQVELPLLIQRGEDHSHIYRWTDQQLAEYEADVIAPVRSITQNGINTTSVADHLDLVYFAFSYQPSVYSTSISLNEDLVRDLFDSFRERGG